MLRLRHVHSKVAAAGSGLGAPVSSSTGQALRPAHIAGLLADARDTSWSVEARGANSGDPAGAAFAIRIKVSAAGRGMVLDKQLALVKRRPVKPAAVVPRVQKGMNERVTRRTVIRAEEYLSSNRRTRGFHHFDSENMLCVTVAPNPSVSLQTRLEGTRNEESIGSSVV